MKTYFLALLTIIMLVSCSTNNNKNSFNSQLPTITQTGANTFGCLINGKVMVPRNSIGYEPPGNHHYAVSYFTSDNYFIISAGDLRDTHLGSIGISIKKTSQNKPLPIGEYPIFNGIKYSDIIEPENTSMNAYVFKNNIGAEYVSIENTGKINILKNDIIFAGTFSCKMKNLNDPNDIIEITEGRFDFNGNINTTNFD